ncbi:TadE family protein [Nesterenkonia marinintestina]|uniref:TadE family protein n=1 Tax=Nesterenkonia marinintestina TaxID=2979865 RepID=UPI0021C19004|nr:TadE family protein [Nesterenkonia sp. GX14115]
MGRPVRAERQTSETGSVSAEFALALPAVLMVLALVLGLGVHAAGQVSLEEGVRAAAREIARGEEPQQALRIAQRGLTDGASFDVVEDGEYVRVTGTRPVRLLGVVELSAAQSAEAAVRTERIRPDGGR